MTTNAPAGAYHVKPHEDPIEGESIHDATPGPIFAIMALLTLLALAWLVFGCTTNKNDPWKKWQSENPAEEYHFDSATGRWERAK